MEIIVGKKYKIVNTKDMELSFMQKGLVVRVFHKARGKECYIIDTVNIDTPSSDWEVTKEFFIEHFKPLNSKVRRI